MTTTPERTPGDDVATTSAPMTTTSSSPDERIASHQHPHRPSSTPEEGGSSSNSSRPPPFLDSLHVSYITSLASKIDRPDSYEGAVTEHLRASGVYWSVAALSILRQPEEVDDMMNLTTTSSSGTATTPPDEGAEEGKDEGRPKRQSIVDWVFECYDPKTGGFGGNVDHDAHLLYTLSCVQILAMAGASGEEAVGLSDPRFDRDAVGKFVSGLQNEDGSFAGDEWGEVDTRFSYCALATLSLLGLLPRPGVDSSDGIIDVDRAIEYVMSCRNELDGGFGCVPGAESHAGQVFCCVGALSIAGGLDRLLAVDGGGGGADLLCWWLAERQCDSGGLNGRPEKQADVCYSWWILSALSILGRVDWIGIDRLASFILDCQDDEDGGISDRPDDAVDVFHTFFGISGLSLLGHLDGGVAGGWAYRKIDPVYALPADVVEGLGLRGQIVRSESLSSSDGKEDVGGVGDEAGLRGRYEVLLRKKKR